jgi:hypothetical protein
VSPVVDEAHEAVRGVEAILRSSGVEGARLGTPVTVENLTVWPVLGDDQDVGEVLTLQEAQDGGLVQIRERGAGEEAPASAEDTSSEEVQALVQLGYLGDDDGATVNLLEVVNLGPLPIVVYAGTVVQGGKQDRQVGVDTILAAGETLPLEAFCVEQSRWDEERDGADTGGVFRAARTMAMKRVRASGQYLDDQAEVWSNVARLNERAGKRAETGTLSITIDEEDAEVLARRAKLSGAVERRLRSGDASPIGFAYAINGEPMTLRVFATASLFERSFGPFLETMCLEAELIQQRDRAAGRDPHAAPATGEALLALLAGIEEAEPEERVLESGTRLLRSSNGWGGKSVCSAATRAPGSWLTTDWTAAVAFGDAEAATFSALGALGYSGD